MVGDVLFQKWVISDFFTERERSDREVFRRCSGKLNFGGPALPCPTQPLSCLNRSTGQTVNARKMKFALHLGTSLTMCTVQCQTAILSVPRCARHESENQPLSVLRILSWKKWNTDFAIVGTRTRCSSLEPENDSTGLKRLNKFQQL